MSAVDGALIRGYHHHAVLHWRVLTPYLGPKMKPSKQLQYKGLRRFRYANEAEKLRDALASPYRWWWSFLRLSKDYWWVCQQKGNTLDGDLKAMWQDFGDVFAPTFNDWWRKRGRMLFAEQVRLPHVRKIDDQFSNVSVNRAGYVVVEIPLNLTERTISRQVLAILRAEAGRKIQPKSEAKRRLSKWRGIRIDVLSVAHDVWSFNCLIERAKQPKSNVGKPFDAMTSQQLGIALRLVRSCMPKFTDGEDAERKKRNGMKVAVSRMLTRANAVIANAEIGIFPSFAPVAARRRWTAKQQMALDAAVAAGKWRPPAADEGSWRNRLGKPKLPG
jgi:hypothetical protein